MVDLPDGPRDLHAGIYGVRPMEMSLPGGSVVPIAGLTWVGVHPDSRRRGVLGAMMTDHLTRTHDAGTVLSALHASEAAIYGRYGYGNAVLTHQVTLGRGTTFTAPHLEDEVAADHHAAPDDVRPRRGRADARLPARPRRRLPRHDRRHPRLLLLAVAGDAGAAARQGAPPHPLRAPRRRGHRLHRPAPRAQVGQRPSVRDRRRGQLHRRARRAPGPRPPRRRPRPDGHDQAGERRRRRPDPRLGGRPARHRRHQDLGQHLGPAGRPRGGVAAPGLRGRLRRGRRGRGPPRALERRPLAAQRLLRRRLREPAPTRRPTSPSPSTSSAPASSATASVASSARAWCASTARARTPSWRARCAPSSSRNRRSASEPPEEVHHRGMVRSRAALTVGLLIVLTAFAYGTEITSSTTVAGSRADCGPAISASWLVAGSPDATSGASLATASGLRRHAAACDPVLQRARAGVLATMAAGALVALVGWSAHREPRALSADRHAVGRLRPRR